MSNTPYYQYLYELKQLGRIAYELKRMNDLKEKELQTKEEKNDNHWTNDRICRRNGNRGRRMLNKINKLQKDINTIVPTTFIRISDKNLTIFTEIGIDEDKIKKLNRYFDADGYINAQNGSLIIIYHLPQN